MKIALILLINFIISSSAFAQSIVCNSSGCVPSGLQATVQEKTQYSAVELGFNTEDFSIQTGSGPSIKPLRMSLSNGEFPGKSISVDLSSNLDGKDAGNIIVFADNIDTLNIKLNGYSGTNGLDASQICANRILANQYGNDVRLRFLQRRASAGSGLSNDRCAQVDVDDIQSNKFSCNDPSYSSLDPNDAKINVTRIRKIARCQAVVPQNVCYQKTYTFSCNYRVYIKSINNYYEAQIGNIMSTHCSCPDDGASWTGCHPSRRANGVNSYGGNGSTYNYNFFRKDGAAHPVSTGFTKQVTQQELQQLLAQNGDMLGVCKMYAANDSSLNWIRTSRATINMHMEGNDKEHCSPFNYYCNCGGRNRDYHQSGNSGDFDWVYSSHTNPVETGPGRDSTLQRLSGGTPFTPSPNGNGALRQTNAAGWQLEIMPAFYPSCNPFFSFITTETSNIVKSLYDPNQFNNEASYCINPSNSSNCSINPPYCDDPSSSVNCRKVSICEQINKKYCLDPENPTNCSQPPFCDDPLNSNNCSANPISKSCDPADPLNSFCEKDPNNLGQYQFIGNEPDPFKNTESFDCRANNCPAEYKSVEQRSDFDVISPTNGQNGTQPGQGLFFVYDIRSVTQQSVPGQAGAGGQSDLTSDSQVRYCATKRDFTTDPNTKFENDPEVTFRKIIWRSFDVRAGGQPGQFPPFTDKKVEVFKKLDPATRYLLKKELL